MAEPTRPEVRVALRKASDDGAALPKRRVPVAVKVAAFLVVLVAAIWWFSELRRGVSG